MECHLRLPAPVRRHRSRRAPPGARTSSPTGSSTCSSGPASATWWTRSARRPWGCRPSRSPTARRCSTTTRCPSRTCGRTASCPSRRTGARTSSWRTSSSTSRPTTYEPPRALLDFLAAGEAPIYVGFGSVVAEDPAALTRTIFTALEQAGARGIVSRGLGAPGRRGAAAERLRDRRLSARLAVPALPGRLPSRRCRDHRRGPARRAADGRRAVLRRSVLLGARSSRTPAPGRSRFRSAGSTARRSRRPSTPCRRPQIRERASELGARLRATDGVELAVQSIERHLPARRDGLLARPGPPGRRLLRHVRRPPLRGLLPRGPLGARGPPLSLRRLGARAAARARRPSWGSWSATPPRPCRRDSPSSCRGWSRGATGSSSATDEPSRADRGGPVRKLRRWLALR